MAQPGAAPVAGVYPINVHWTQQKGWWVTPQTTKIPLNQTAQFVTDTNCTICFSPTTTPFGASQDVNAGTPLDIPVGPTPFSVNLCATVQGQTCPAARPTDAMGTIIIGSGPEGGR